MPSPPQRSSRCFPSSMMSFKLGRPAPPRIGSRPTATPASRGAPTTWRGSFPCASSSDHRTDPRRSSAGGRSGSTISRSSSAMSTDVALLLNDPTPAQRTVFLRLSIGASRSCTKTSWSGPRARDLTLLTTIAARRPRVRVGLEDRRIDGVDISVTTVPGERRLRLVDAAASAPPRRAQRRLAATVRLAGRAERKRCASCISRSRGRPPRAARPS